ncbi:MAG TPA: error-prone DNA polymerase [Dongiaceae bacterium]|jgi:error-prone DNA polymerase|nr:error-prone DNA polymerase [Dongiaceae bacterium]
MAPFYAELQATSNFTFLTGGSHPEELVFQAHGLGHAAFGLTDRNSVAGIVRAHIACKQEGMRFLPGTRLDFQDCPSLLCYPSDKAAYGRLCEMLTLGRRRAPKGECHLFYEDLLLHREGQRIIILPDERPDLAQHLERLRDALDHPFLALSHLYRGDDVARLRGLGELASAVGLAPIATNDVLYHVPERRALQDVLSCIRQGCTIEKAGFSLLANAERHVKSPAEMVRLFRPCPEAIENVARFVAGCRFSLDELRYEYPDEVVDPGEGASDTLKRLAWAGARWRYPSGIPEKVKNQLHHEFQLVDKLNYAPYFLTVADLVRHAREKGILHQGRGSAANSVICYCLGITAVDPKQIDLLFERFISDARNEPPDIDVDFEHERREEIIQYIYEKYGRARAALTATVICYRSRAAIRDVGKALGLSSDTIAALSKSVWGWSSRGITDREILQAGLDPTDRRLRMAVACARELIGFPRHLSQHVGGFVISRSRLSSLVPVENAAMADRTVIQWDKDDIEALGMLKVDVLGLGMLSCIRRAFDLLKERSGTEYSLASIPQGDPGVYDMICRAETIGVFQIESRAQMSMLPRLKPRSFYDLVIEVALVRPGPIQGDMVHPYLRRREGREQVIYPSEELRRVLEKTLGVPLFQEQAMQIAITAASFTPSEADQLRRAMATFKKAGTIASFGEKLVSGMIARGYDPAFAERCFNQIKGFGTYGFPESHAASFAQLVYISAWIKHHYPDVFCCALLNSQPMGFYAPAQLIRDAQDHGVRIATPDINHSIWDATLCGEKAVRLGFRQVKGFDRDMAERLVTARGKVAFSSIDALQERARLDRFALTRLAEADAFRSLDLDRREALWRVKALEIDKPPLFATGQVSEEPAILRPMPLSQHVIEDYRFLSLSVKQHPVAFLRERLAAKDILPTQALATERAGKTVMVAGLVLVRQRPGTGKAIFMTLEDETGIANLIFWPDIFERYRATVMGARMIICRGRLQREGRPPHHVIHLLAHELYDATSWLDALRENSAQDRGEIEETLPLRSRDFH